MTHTVRLPKGWAETSLAEIAKINPKNPERIPEDIEEVSFVPMTRVEAGTGRLHPDETREWGAVKKGYKRFQDGDVLFAKITPCMENGKTALAQGLKGGVAAGSTEYHVLRPTVAVSDKLLMYYLLQKSVRRDARAQMTGTAGQLRVPRSFLQERVLSIPPLGEQHRILEAIELYLTRLDDAVALLKRVQQNLKRYRASVLKAAVEGRLVPTEAELAKKEGRDYEPASELLSRILVERRKKWIEDAAEKARAKAEEKAHKTGKPWTHTDNVKTLEKESAKAAEKYKEPDLPDINDLPDLPEGWCWASVEQIVDVGTGATPKRGEPRYWKDGTIPWVSSAVVNHPYVNEVAERVTETAIQETNLTVYSPGTLLVAMYGEGKTRGKATELTIESTTNQALAALVFTKASAALRRFLKLFMEHNYSSIRRAASGGVQPNLNLGIVKVIAVPLPPLAEQERVCTTVESLLSVGNEVERSAQLNTSRSMRFRQSILKWAFEGKLVEQDPNDEPASKLLERIKAERETMQPHKRRRANRQRSNEPTKHDEQLDLLEGNNT